MEWFLETSLGASTALITVFSTDLCVCLSHQMVAPLQGRDKACLTHGQSPSLPSLGCDTQQVLNQNVLCG